MLVRRLQIFNADRPLLEAVSTQKVVLAQSGAMHPSPVTEAFKGWVAQEIAGKKP